MTALNEAQPGIRAKARPGDREWFKPLITLAAVLVVAMAAHFGPRLVPRSLLASVIEKDVCPQNGIDCHVVGPVHLSLLPFPAIEAKGLMASAVAGQAGMSAARVVAGLRALPLLIGQLSVDHLDLTEARFEFTVPRAGMRLLDRADGAVTALLDRLVSAARIRHRLTRIAIAHSRLIIHAETYPDFVIDDLSAGLSWPRRSGPVDVGLTGRVGHEQLMFSLEGPAFADLVKTEGSHVSINVALGDNSLAFAGRLVQTKDLVAAGLLQATLVSTKRLANLFGMGGWPAWLPDSPIRGAGPAFIAARGIDFDNADFEMGGSRFTGVLSLRSNPDGRPALMGTLASALVDAGDLGFVPDRSLAFSDLAQLPDLDLRLSIRKLVAKGTSFDAVAAGLILSDGRLDLTLSQGLPRQSAGKLRLVATLDEEGVALKTQASGENIDVGAVMSSLSPHAALSGSGAFALNLEARGGEVATLLRSLSGKASLMMKSGLLSLDSDGALVASLGAAEGSPSTSARHFSEASFAGTAEHGVLTLTEGHIGTGASQIAVDGHIDVGERDLDLALSGADSTKPDASWHLRAVGPWSAPTLWRQPAAP
jgi:uncharacterized protein involved in outer membrane biogenesis